MVEVSIIVPVYNVEAHLEACVWSILGQTFTKFELILVDDGSTDKSASICDAFKNKDSRVHVFHKENGGVSSARNKGLSEATGNFVMFADSDDIVDPMWVENLLKSITSTKTDLAICSYVIKNESLGAARKIAYHKGTCCIKKKEEWLEFWSTFLENRNHMVLSLWNKLFRRDIICKHGLSFDESLSHSEDAIFVFEYLKLAKHKISISDAVGYYYFKRNEESLTNKYKPDYWTVKQHCFRVLYDTITQHDIEWEEIKISFATYINTIIVVSINNVLKLGWRSFKKMCTLGKEILNSKECRWGTKNADYVDVHWLYRWVLKTRCFPMIFIFHVAVMIKTYRKR